MRSQRYGQGGGPAWRGKERCCQQVWCACKKRRVWMDMQFFKRTLLYLLWRLVRLLPSTITWEVMKSEGGGSRNQKSPVTTFRSWTCAEALHRQKQFIYKIKLPGGNSLHGSQNNYKDFDLSPSFWKPCRFPSPGFKKATNSLQCVFLKPDDGILEGFWKY